MSKGYSNRMILSPQPRQQQIIHQRMIASMKLLMSPALSSTPGKCIPAPVSAPVDNSAQVIKEVSRLIKGEKSTRPLSDREILSRVQLKIKDSSLSTQSIARARFRLGIAPSARRHR